jgi:hypothetical protein
MNTIKGFSTSHRTRAIEFSRHPAKPHGAPSIPAQCTAPLSAYLQHYRCLPSLAAP